MNCPNVPNLAQLLSVFFFFFSLFMNGTTIHSVTQVHNSELLPLSIPCQIPSPMEPSEPHFCISETYFLSIFTTSPPFKTTLSFSVHPSTYWASASQKKAENTNGTLMTVTCLIMSCAVLRALHALVHSVQFSRSVVSDSLRPHE